MIKVVHVVNQFFAGLGGEEKAGLPVGIVTGSAGAARALSRSSARKRRSFARFMSATIISTSTKTRPCKQFSMPCERPAPEVMIAGPAFNSGRYGLTCVEICNSVAQGLEIPCLTAMHEENPGVGRISRTRQFAGVLFTDD